MKTAINCGRRYMRQLRRGLLLLSLALSVLLLQPAAGGDAQVAATIAPVHSLLQAILGKEETALLLLPPDSSPHGAFLPPSKARQLWKTKALFYVHEELENFLQSVLPVLPPKVYRVRLADSHSDIGAHVEPLVHDHDHDHDSHNVDSDNSESITSDEHADNFHVWLDPHYAMQMSERMADVLSELNPPQREHYKMRAQQLQTRLQKLDSEIESLLSPLREKPFAVAHDAYGDFVRRYQLRAPIVIGDAHGLVSAKDVARAKRAMQDAGVTCILGDRHLSLPSMHSERLNPSGAGFEPGAELYFMLMRQLAKTVADCLSSG